MIDSKTNEADRPDPNLSGGSQEYQTGEMCQATMSAIHRLREAYDAAFGCGRDVWDFSVELSEMQKAGIETYVL